MRCLVNGQNLDSIDKIIDEKLSILEKASLDLLPKIFGWVLEAVDLTPPVVVSSPRYWESLKVIFTKLLGIFKEKNFDISDTVSIFNEYLDTLEAVFGYISSTDLENVKDITSVISFL